VSPVRAGKGLPRSTSNSAYFGPPNATRVLLCSPPAAIHQLYEPAPTLVAPTRTNRDGPAPIVKGDARLDLHAV
jgi:hypothetical protein